MQLVNGHHFQDGYVQEKTCSMVSSTKSLLGKLHKFGVMAGRNHITRTVEIFEEPGQGLPKPETIRILSFTQCQHFKSAHLVGIFDTIYFLFCYSLIQYCKIAVCEI